jgi:predicted membrane chloride channel (bestrophin family)
MCFQQLFFLGIKEGIAIADILMGASNGKAVQVAFSLLMAATTPIMFQGLLEFVVMIRNPFGSDWIDLPISSIYQDMRDGMFQYVANGEAAVSLPSVKQSVLG